MSATTVPLRQLGVTRISGTANFVFSSEDSGVVNGSITSAAIYIDKIISIMFIPIAVDPTSLDDFQASELAFNIENIVDGVSFDLRARAGNNATGTYRVNYIILVQN